MMIEMCLHKKLHGASGEMWLKAELSIDSGSFVALSGQSGSGKTTLLRMLAGLETPDSGHLIVDGEPWIAHEELEPHALSETPMMRKIDLPPQKREIGFVFQDYALFPNMSVLENLLFVAKDQPLASELLEMVELSELKNRSITTLSGGQKQRVALARALMRRPKLLLLDEPLSALDPAMRSKLQQELLDIHTRFGTTTILVSHDPAEIYRLCSRVIVLHLGEIKRDGSPREVLMSASGSQKFSFTGEILEIAKVDVMHIAVVAIGTQLVEVVLDSQEAAELATGDRVSLSTKAFAPSVRKIV